jgi:hypothetical protein
VPEREPHRSKAGLKLHPRRAPTQKETTRKELATRRPDGLKRATLTKKEKPRLTLKSGAVLNAREAIAIWEDLEFLLDDNPAEFLSLLALAQDRPSDADPKHLESLQADTLIGKDNMIDPLVRDVLLNSFELTKEGPVITPLRLLDEANLPIAQQGEKELHRWVRKFASRAKRQGPSKD